MRRAMLVGLFACSNHAATPLVDAPAPPLDTSAAADAPAGGGMALGTVSTGATVACPTGALPGSTCMHVTVDCSAATGAEAIGAVVMITEPSATAKGTVWLHNGGPGTTMPSPQPDYVQAGFRTVAIAWDTTWEDSANASVGTLAAACRPATIMKWAFDVPHGGTHATAFCAQGASAGSSAIGYSLAHYGMGAYVDHASFVSGPPMGRIDIGCAPSTYSGPPRALCTGQNGALADAPIAYVESFAQALINGGEHTTTCNSGTASTGDLARWAADSIVSPGAVYAYPSTPVAFFFCTSSSTNEVTGLGSFYLDQITSTATASCFTQCTGENVGQDPAGKAAIAQAMLTDCVPRH